MKKSLTVLLLILSFKILANSGDSLVLLNDLKFSSDFEKDNITQAVGKNEKLNYLSLLLATDPASTAGTYREADLRLAEIFKTLDGEDLDKKSEAKKIKLIYKTVHDTFLKKYEYKNNFSEIFKNGNYNCVSATALYSIVLDRYNIPYTIKKAPSHVFLLTYPDTYKILIETTDPVKGYVQYNDQMIANYVNHLKKAKLISEQEFTTKSEAQIFGEYFLKDENVNLKQMVGLQYNNLAFYEYENEKYAEAFRLMQKAYVFYPTEGMKFLLKNMLLAILPKVNYESDDDVKYFSYLTRFKTDDDGDLNVEMISGEFVRITQKQLINKSNFSLYNKSYQEISKSVSDSSLRKEIDFIYNYEYARAIINAEKDEDIEKNLKIIYSIKPEHLEVQALISHYVLSNLKTNSNPESVLLTLDKYSRQYTFLSGTNKVASIYGMCYLELASTAYSRNDVAKGDQHLHAFEAAVKGKDKVTIDDFYINKSFAEASAAYYRKGNMTKAKNMIIKGLEYAPSSPYLKFRLETFQ